MFSFGIFFKWLWFYLSFSFKLKYLSYLGYPDRPAFFVGFLLKIAVINYFLLFVGFVLNFLLDDLH